MLKPAVATDSNVFLGEEASPWHRTQEFKSANCRSGRAVTSRQSATTSGSPCYGPPLGMPDDIGSMTPVTFDGWPSYADPVGSASPPDEVRALLALSATYARGACADGRELAETHLAEARGE